MGNSCNFLGNLCGIIIWAGILSFKLPWYYRTLPRYYHMCRYLLSYASAVFSHVPVSSLLGFRSNSTFPSGWSQSSFLWSLGFLDSPSVTVCLWASEVRRTRPFQLSSVSQQLATCVESFFCLLMGTSLFHLGEFYRKTHHRCIISSLFWLFDSSLLVLGYLKFSLQ